MFPLSIRLEYDAFGEKIATGKTMSFEVAQPILNSPYDEPSRHWFIPEGAPPEERAGRRPPFVFQPRRGELTWDVADGTLARLPEYRGAREMILVSRVRERLAQWRAAGYPGATRTTVDLLQWWRREGRDKRLFFAQIEAAESVIFLREARPDLLQGLNVPVDETHADTTGQRLCRLHTAGLQDGDRCRQDDRDGDDLCPVDPEQGCIAERRPVLGFGARRLPERDDS